MKGISTIGHLKKLNGRWVVHCATCGEGVGCSAAIGKKQAASDLCTLGWTDAGGLWRCPKNHSIAKRPLSPIERMIDKATGFNEKGGKNELGN